MQQKYGDVIVKSFVVFTKWRDKNCFVLLFPVEIFPESLGVLEQFVRDRQISLIISSEFKSINFYFPQNHQKIYDILMMSGWTEVLICLNSLNSRSKIWRRPLQTTTFVPSHSRTISKSLQKYFFWKGKLSAGFSRHLVMPQKCYEGIPIFLLNIEIYGELSVNCFGKKVPP